MDLKEIAWDGVHRIGVVQDRDKWSALVNAIMKVGLPASPVKLSSGFTTGGLSSSAQFHRAS
jgi:hypothetical protein